MNAILQQYWQSLLWTNGYQLSGLAMTLWLLVFSMVVGGILALFLSMGRTSSRRWLSTSIALFTFVFRGTPLYVQLIIIYTGLYTLHVVKDHQLLNEFFRSGLHCTLLALTLNTAAYTTEILAGAIRAVPAGEIEAAQAYGFRGVTLWRSIILPSAFRTALPAYSNEVILLLHSTSLAFTATVPDILKVARDINANTYQPFTAFGIAALLYLFISCVLIMVFRQIEKRWLPHISSR